MTVNIWLLISPIKQNPFLKFLNILVLDSVTVKMNISLSLGKSKSEIMFINHYRKHVVTTNLRVLV